MRPCACASRVACEAQDFRTRRRTTRLTPTAVDTIYINLRGRTDRRRKMDARLAQVGLERAVRFEAVTGARAASSDVTREWETSLNARFDSAMVGGQIVALTPGERGCAASHAALWRRVAERADEGAPLLVLEDDLIVCEEFGERMAALIRVVERAVPRPSQRTLLLYPGAFVGPCAQSASRHRTRRACLRAAPRACARTEPSSRAR
jgi:hypothetical protein